MSNQVVLPANTVPNSAFNQFSQPKNGFYINTPVNIEEEKKKERKYGKSIVVGSLVAGFGILAIMKGALPKSIGKYLDKWKIKLAKKSEKSGKFQNFYRFALGKVSSFRDKFESINNFTTMKDVLFQKFMFGTEFTRKIHTGITGFFNKISRRTVNSSYSKTQRKFAGLNEYMASLNERILSKNSNAADAIKSINERMVRVNTKLDEGFGINARNTRLRQMDKAYKGLFENFWNASLSDVRNFRSRNMYQSYIAEDYLMPAKMKMANETGLLRQAITHDINDNYKAAIKAADNIQKFVNPTDMPVNDALYTLRNNLAAYKKLSGNNEASQRLELNKKIIENLNRLSSTFGSSESNYTPEAQKAISTYISDVKNIISKNSKGELQEVLTSYKQILPRKEYLKLRAKVNSAVKLLDNSIDVETTKYFDKARDLKLGSAPTDVLSILATAGTVGWFLGKAKNKDEKISASLKYGIPAVGTIATSLLLTAKLVSGGKAFALGLLSGWIINKIGVQVDNLRKKYALDVSLQNKTRVKPQPDKV